MDKAKAIERLEYLKARAQIALEQEVPEWIAEDVLGTIEAYDMAIEALQTEPNCSEKPNNSTISKMEQVDYDCKSCKHDLWHTPRMCGKCVRQEDGKPSMYESKTEPQTDIEIARAIVHKAIDDAVIAEDAYPDLRQKMHDAVDSYEPQTEDPPMDEFYKDHEEFYDTDCAWKGEES